MIELTTAHKISSELQ